MDSSLSGTAVRTTWRVVLNGWIGRGVLESILVALHIGRWCVVDVFRFGFHELVVFRRVEWRRSGVKRLIIRPLIVRWRKRVGRWRWDDGGSVKYGR